MKKVRLLLPLLLLLVTPMTAQIDRGPTIKECRADADAWGIPKSSALVSDLDQFSKLTGDNMYAKSVSAGVLESRSAEFAQCEKTDNEQAGRYYQARSAYSIAEFARVEDFMQRHSLMTQFYHEDELGLR
jgi:hypothetical protein